ncbi:hypothetical protein ANTPLA_LOCUS10472 [Anthophora plagiata]
MIDISRNSPCGYDQRLEVFGPKGIITTDKQQPLSDTLAVSKIASACEESVRTGNMVEIKWAEGELP